MKKKERSRLVSLPVPVFTLLVIMAGCAVNTYSSGGPISNIGLERVVRDPGLASDIKIDAARIDDRGGSKLGQLTLRNAGGTEKRIAVKFDWFNSDGVNLSGSRNDWDKYTLYPGEIKEVTSMGSSSAKDFRASIRNQ